MKTYCLEVSIHENFKLVVAMNPGGDWWGYGLNLLLQHLETLTWLHLENVTLQSLFLLFR